MVVSPPAPGSPPVLQLGVVANLLQVGVMSSEEAPVRKLTTTSYAILGLFSLRPWSAYELAKQMRRSLRFYLPRAESALYEEPKNLVAHGLARAATERRGRRNVAIYSITAKGRRALEEWVQKPSAPPQFEAE